MSSDIERLLQGALDEEDMEPLEGEAQTTSWYG